MGRSRDRRGAGRPAAWATGRLASVRSAATYFSDVKAEVQSGVAACSDAAARSCDADVGLLVPHVRDRRRARSVIFLSTSAHACARSSPSTSVLASSICGVDLRVVELRTSSSCRAGMMFAPVERRVEHRLRVREVLDPADVRADRRPSACGTWQNFVYIVSLRHLRGASTLKPSLLSCCWATSALRLAAARRCRRPSGSSRCRCTCPTDSRPSSCTSSASAQVALGVRHEVVHRAAFGAAGLLEAGDARRDAVRRRSSPTSLPPRVWRSASRSKPAIDRLAHVDVVERLDRSC